jgi:hypothetical protein
MFIEVTKPGAIVVGFCLLLYTSDVSAEGVEAMLFQQHSGSSRSAGQAPANQRSAPVSQPHAPDRRPTVVHPATRAPVGGSNQPSARTPDTPNTSYRPSDSRAGLSPVPVRLSPSPIAVRTQLRVASRESWQAAADNERNARRSGQESTRFEFRQQALTQYKLAVSNLQQTRDSQGTQFVPGTYVPLAKSHLDAARVLFLLNRQEEANFEVQSAEALLRDLLLHQQRDNPLPRGWLWRIYYLLGDVNLYENNQSIALYNYQGAEALNPDFVPASAMIEYLGGTVNVPQPPSVSTVVAGDHEVATPAPPAVAQAQPQETRGTLYQEMKQISPFIPPAATVVTLVAQIFEITELAPIATAITLAGMIVDYTVKH